MGDSNNKNNKRTTEMENLSLGISSTFSRDLLQRFSNRNEYEFGKEEEEEEEEEEEGGEIELNLGLSLGGRFGVDRSSKKLVRSSSIASVLPLVRDDNEASAAAPPPASVLMRTSSLPVETEEEWRKRKELQTLRRMEAKRRRSEKQRIMKGEKEGGGGSMSLEERKEMEGNLRERLEREKYLSAMKRISSSKSLGRCGSDVAMGKGKGSYGGGSVESKGGSSSCVSDLESKTLQGSSGELSPASIQSLQEGSTRDIGSFATQRRENTSRSIGSDMESASKRPDSSRARPRDMGASSSAEDMPCVFTKGDGPNGRRVDGILYKYGKGEEVRIMCVCHGSFHSPAEFIKHAGGTDVENPLKHIVVNPNASSFL